MIKKKPYVSLIVLFYNHEDFVKDTLDGVFSQTYENMEIIISDDASPDGTFAAVERYMAEYKSAKQVIINRNEKNMGLVPHLNYIIKNYVHGDIVALAGGDDISMPNRVSDTVNILESNQDIKAVTGQPIIIDKKGQVMEDTAFIKEGIYRLDDSYIKSFSFMCGGYGLSISKEVWDTFGALHPECPTEDSTLRFRSLLLGSIAVAPEVFIKYRIHGNNLSGQSNIFNLKTARIAEQYRCDLEKAKELKLIDSEMEKRLNKKIWYYVKERNLAATKQGLPRLLRAPYKFLQLILNRKVDRI